MRLLEQYQKMHLIESNFAGGSLRPHLDRIYDLTKKYRAKSLLDYGCGKAMLYKHQDEPIILANGVKGYCVTELLGVSAGLYDPGYSPYAIKPKGKFDVVICTDVLEHIPELELDDVIQELFWYAEKAIYASISTRKAKKTLYNGENAHCTVKPESWWVNKFDTLGKRSIETILNFPDASIV